MKARKGQRVRGGPADPPCWGATVLGLSRQGVRIRWETGPLAGREAHVPASTLHPISERAQET